MTIAAEDNALDESDKRVTVSATAVGGRGMADPSDKTLTIRDNDAAEPMPTLVLSPSSIPESGGTATVTATLNRAVSAATTVTVSVSPVSSTGATANDFTLSDGRR